MKVYLRAFRMIGLVGLAAMLVLAGCGPQQDDSGLVVMNSEQLTATAIAMIPTATATYTPSLTPTSTHTPTPTDTPTVTPTPTNTPFSTNTPHPSPTVPPTETEIPPATEGPTSSPEEATWTPPPLDQAMTIDDHYYLGRPIPVGQNFATWASRSYPYGSTNGGRLQIHHGVDIENPTGVPVVAVADGTVVYAGDDIGTIFGPSGNFYGNVIVIQHNFVAPSTGEPVYTLYGHLSSIEVRNGDAISQGDQIGGVGAAGVALGPHLHFEVRVGDPYSYGATRNPELWIRPYYGYGTLTGAVRNTSGAFLYDVTIDVISATDPSFRRSAFSYAGDSVNSDPVFGENFTLGDLPEDYYNVVIRADGRRLYSQQIYIPSRKSTWLDITING